VESKGFFSLKDEIHQFLSHLEGLLSLSAFEFMNPKEIPVFINPSFNLGDISLLSPGSESVSHDESYSPWV